MPGNHVVIIIIISLVMLAPSWVTSVAQAATLAHPVSIAAPRTSKATETIRTNNTRDRAVNQKNIEKTARHNTEAVIRVGFFYLDPLLTDFIPFPQLHDALAAHIQLANTAFQNSAIPGRFELTHLERWPAEQHAFYHDQDAYNTYQAMKETIDHLWQTGYLMQRGIDVVFLVDYRENDIYCGWASINTIEELARSTDTRNYGLLRLGPGCGLNSMAFIHEVGHLLGAAHSIDDPAQATDPRGHGYHCGERYTIMHSRYLKHDFFSNPWHEKDSQRCGRDGEADNAHLLADRLPLLVDKTPAPATDSVLTLRRDAVDANQLILDRHGTITHDAYVSVLFSTAENLTENSTDPTGLDHLHQLHFEPNQLTITLAIPSRFSTHPNTQVHLLNADRLAPPYYQTPLSTLSDRPAVFQMSLSVTQTHVQLTITHPETSVNVGEVIWGDGQITPLESLSQETLSPEHTYEIPGNYDIAVTLSDNQGNETTRALQLSVPTPPESIAFGTKENRLTHSEDNTGTPSTSRAGSIHPWNLLMGLLLIAARRWTPRHELTRIR